MLEVSSVASLDEVMHAYQRKIRRYHSDMVAGFGPAFTEIANLKPRRSTWLMNKGVLHAVGPSK